MPAGRLRLRPLAALGAISTLLAAAGCGSKGKDLAPVACLAGNQAYLEALAVAPGPVRLAGGVPISDCLVPEQNAGQLANVGHELVIAASKLNVQARRDPGGPASLQLGYLIGAIARGADPIHAELVRRLNAAAQFSQRGGALPAGFQRAFGRGYAAGHATG